MRSECPNQSSPAQHSVTEVHMTAITLDQAERIIDAIIARGSALNCRPLSVIVVESGCKVKAFKKEDGASMIRFGRLPDKDLLDISSEAALAALADGGEQAALVAPVVSEQTLRSATSRWLRL